MQCLPTGAAGLLCQTGLASGRLGVNQRSAATCPLSSFRDKYFAFVMDSADRVWFSGQERDDRGKL